MHCDLRKSRHGFSMVELILVITALASITSIAIPTVTSLIAQANQAVCTTNRSLMERMYKQYTAAGNSYDVSGKTDAQFLVDAHLLESTPACPSGGKYSWTVDADGTVHVRCSIHGKS